MTTFDKREKAFESQLAYEEEVRFRAIARRNRLFGLWIAGKLGKSGADADAYAARVVQAEVDGGAEKAVELVKADLAAKGVTLSDHQLKVKADELLAEAVAEIRAGV
ncbi:DUF1476 domain-containing protein [Methylocella sp.]|uniref:DUF1476 domain-containing protein n=1 Tax=Methylocella sp. TaxID=1978226 RepID=UPI003784FD0A